MHLHGSDDAAELCRRLRALFSTLRSLLHPLVDLHVRFSLDGHPNQADLQPMFPVSSNVLYSGASAEYQRPLLSALHLLELHTDYQKIEDRETGTGKVTVTFFLRTPLYCTRAKNIVELKVNERELKVDRTKKAVVPECEVSDQNIVWAFEVWLKRPGYCGWFPKFEKMYRWDRKGAHLTNDVQNW